MKKNQPSEAKKTNSIPSQKTPKESSQSAKKDAYKNFYPITQFIKKHPQEESDMQEQSAFVYVSKMRTKYTSLPNKKKLKLVKEVEHDYDKFDFSTLGVNSESNKPLFSSFLSKNEAKLLFESYGMPESIPLNK